MAEFVVRAHPGVPVEPRGLDYCRRNNLNDQYDHAKWTTNCDSDDLEEILIVGCTVIWTTGTKLKRAFDLSDEHQAVKQALFVYFPSPQTLFEGPASSGSGKESLLRPPSSRLFALNTALKSTANVAHIPASNDLQPTQRALVILLEDLLHIYHEDGRRDLVNLPFPIKRAYALKSGLILERMLDLEEFPRSFVRKLDSVPKLFVLRDPLEHMGLVASTDRDKHVLSISDELCYVDGDYCVMRNQKESTVSVWKLKRISENTPHCSINPAASNSMRRRSSMRASTMGSLKLEDFVEEVHAPSIHAEIVPQLDRTPFIGLDPVRLFDSSDFLQKDYSLELIGTVHDVVADRALDIFTLDDTISCQIVFYVFCQDERNLIEVTLKTTRGGKMTLHQMRRQNVLGIQKLTLLANDYALVHDAQSRVLFLTSPGSPVIIVDISTTFTQMARYHKDNFLLRESCSAPWHIQSFAVDDDPLVKQAMTFFQALMAKVHYKLFFAIYLSTIHRFKDLSSMDAFVVAVFSCYLVANTNDEIDIDSCNSNVDTSILQKINVAYKVCVQYDTSALKAYLPQMLLALHFLHEENGLSILTAHDSAIIPVLIQLSVWLSWNEYTTYYSAQLAKSHELAIEGSFRTAVLARIFNEPPSFERWAVSIMQGAAVELHTIESILPRTVNSTYHKIKNNRTARELCPVTFALSRTYTCLVNKRYSSYEVVVEMLALGLTKFMLLHLPRGLALPVQDFINHCAFSPSSEWSSTALAFIGRNDLVHFSADLEERSKICRYGVAPLRPTANFMPEATQMHDEHERRTSPSNDIYNPISLIFDQDRRIQEVSKILTCHEPTSVVWNSSELLGEAEQIREQQKLSRRVANRTLAIPLGRALYHFNSRYPLPTEKFSIRKLNFDIKIRPVQVTITEDKSYQDPDLISWPVFHNGVSAGLSIAQSAEEISASWIAYSKPAELDDEHAGFLLGLGLNGHLRAMTTWHAFNYLASKHNMTSIGLLLGLSASFLGSMDPMVAKLLTVHILALLPPGSNELNLSGTTQSAGVVGLGLLYFASEDRKMSAILLNEIVDQDDSQEKFRDEGYRLSAGIALGMINVGRGEMTTGVCAAPFTSKLLKGVNGVHREKHDLDQKMPGSIIALGLIYLRKNDKYVAEQLNVPENIHNRGYVRPDLYLVRVLASCLIMWDEISPDLEYIMSKLPRDLKSMADCTQVSGQDTEELITLNIVVGACLAIGFKFTGTLATEPRDFLLGYLDKLLKMYDTEDHGVIHRTMKMAVRTHLGVLSLAVAMVMAGSGDLHVLRRLRRLHYRIDPEAWYGNYMAVEMSIGLLFLNQAQSSLKTCDLAICSYIVAFYPLFPHLPRDNRSHLQALRHLWVLGADPRCLVPRDITTNDVCLFPVSVVLKDPIVPVLKVVAPCILPPIDSIKSITANTDNFWPFTLDLESSTRHMRAFSISRTIYVTRRVPGEFPLASDAPDLSTADASSSTNDALISDIMSRFTLQTNDRRTMIGEIISSEEPERWNSLVDQSLLLQSIRRYKGSHSPQLEHFLLAYKQATSSRVLRHRYDHSVELSMNEQFAQKLQLEMWRKTLQAST